MSHYTMVITDRMGEALVNELRRGTQQRDYGMVQLVDEAGIMRLRLWRRPKRCRRGAVGDLLTAQGRYLEQQSLRRIERRTTPEPRPFNLLGGEGGWYESVRFITQEAIRSQAIRFDIVPSSQPYYQRERPYLKRKKGRY